MNEGPKTLTGGFSGDILIHLPPSVLRLYRNTPDNRHIILLKNLGSIGVAPQIYHCFETGHIEEYLNGKPFSMADSEDMFFNVARALAQLHTVPLASIQPVNVWDPWTEMAKCIDNGDGKNASAYIIGGVSVCKISAEIESLHGLLRPFIDSDPLCLSHIDLFRGNIMRCGNNVRLIDWEMAALFHPLYDAANFFCECCIDTSLNYNESLFPSHVRQTEFVRICLGRCATAQDMYILHLFILLSHIYWAVCGVSYTPEYSSARVAQYTYRKDAYTNNKFIG